MLSSRTGERPTPGPARRSADGVGSGSFAVQQSARAAAPGPPAAPRHDAPRHDAPRHGAPPPAPGPPSGPVGGRAAARLEREAAEAAARKGGRRGSSAAAASPAPPRPSAAQEATQPAGAPRRAVQFVLAMVVVALVVLGVWTFTTPRAQVASSASPAGTSEQVVSAEPSVDAPVEAAPSAEVVPSAVALPPGPVRAPVTVLNTTSVTGLAGAIAEQFAAGGWETLQPASYDAADVAITTVFYTEGDAVQQAAAAELVAQFPDVSGPAPRFFEVPGVADPGLVVVATGNWQP